MCSSTKSAAPPTDDESTTTSVVDESTTTTEPTTTTESPTTTLPEEVPDLSGIWIGQKTIGGQTEEGTVLISQTEMTFTLSFSEGFECRPADACEFDGTVETLVNDDGTIEGYVWMASNGGPADDEGGTYESFFGLQPFSAYEGPDDSDVDEIVDPVTREPVDTSDWYMGIGESVYHPPPPDPDMVWDGSLLLKPSG
jgi:hypothetical protein